MNEKIKISLISAVVALAVALFVVAGYNPAPAPVVTTPSGEPTAGLSQVDNGVFPEGVQAGDMISKIVSVSIPANQNQTRYRNTSGRTQYVELASVSTTGTASTTFKVYVGTSTASSLDDYTTPVNPALINGFLLATSSTATTTSNMQVGNSNIRLVPLPDGSYVNFLLQQTFNQANCDGSLCERATSTNRGFNLTGFLRVLQ